jgi:hypothetical protein
MMKVEGRCRWGEEGEVVVWLVVVDFEDVGGENQCGSVASSNFRGNM